MENKFINNDYIRAMTPDVYKTRYNQKSSKKHTDSPNIKRNNFKVSSFDLFKNNKTSDINILNKSDTKEYDTANIINIKLC